MTRASAEDPNETGWVLDRSVDGGKNIQRVPLPRLPYRIGRLEAMDLAIPVQSVSKFHAEITEEGGALRVRDMNSTNGTFVNRKPVSSSALREGDVLHIAEFEFRVGRAATRPKIAADAGSSTTISLGRIDLPEHFPGGAGALAELLEGSLTYAVFQPIVTLPEARIVAYEVLGRGLHPELPRGPAELLRIAEAVECEAALSRLFRRRAVELVEQSGKTTPLLFLNTHPSEIGTPELGESLVQLRDMAPSRELALEIHEGSTARSEDVARLKRQLDELRIALAFDDFGLGERFLQLAEVPPAYLKFDISYVKRLIEAPDSERRLLATLLEAAHDVGSLSIAEGIETEEQAELCCRLGFSLAQGYLYREPMALDDLGPAGAPLESVT